MTQSLSIEVTQFSGFQHVNDVEPLSDNDIQILNHIKKVLVEHGAVDRFGVHLIHKHYDLADDEIVVEYTDEDTRTQTTVVQKRDILASTERPLETQWRFSRETSTMACVGYCDYNNGHRYIHSRK